MNDATTGGLVGSILTRYWLDQEAVRHWSDRGIVGAWVDVEVALAEAQAGLGLIPVEAAREIRRLASIDKIDMERIARDMAATMHPFVPLIHQLEEQCGAEAGGYLHWGATTQNIFDTGLALLLKRGRPLLLRPLDAAMEALAAKALEHKNTLQAGRTHGQHALPITFGYKVASWLAEVRRHRARLIRASKAAEIATFGGAIGTYAAMAGQGRAVQKGVGDILGLGSADNANRASADKLADYVNTLALFAATVEKICDDIYFMQRDEIAEASERFHYGKVGSSTMAQKRNPSHAMNIAGLARILRARAPLAVESMLRADESEGSRNNVMDQLIPECSILAVSLASGLARLIEGMEVNPAAMRRNLDASRGLIMSEAVMMALGPVLGRGVAHHVLYDAAVETVRSGRMLTEVLAERPECAGIDIGALTDPALYLGESAAYIEEEAAVARKMLGTE